MRRRPGRVLRWQLGSRAAVALAVLFVAFPAWADQIGPYAGRSLTLGQGTFRIDGGPPDFGYFHPGGPQWINENRGLRVRRDEGARQTWVWLGLGLAYGITRDIELGGLILPVRVRPDADIDDVELYGRFRFLEGTFEMGAQATVQLPTQNDLGLGLGLPMLVHATDDMRIDTGFEFEILFFEPHTIVSLDAPLALTWDIGRRGLLGMRTGMYFRDMDVLVVPAGIHGGGVLADGRVDLLGWFMWPGFLGSDRDHAFELRTFELGFGVNARID